MTKILELRIQQAVPTEFDVPRNTLKWLNAYIDFIESETISIFVEKVRNSIRNRAKQVEKEMLSTRNRINLQRENLLLKYEEAVQIAFKLGIKDGIDNNSFDKDHQI